MGDEAAAPSDSGNEVASSVQAGQAEVASGVEGASGGDVPGGVEVLEMTREEMEYLKNCNAVDIPIKGRWLLPIRAEI